MVSLARGLSHNDASQTLFYYLALIIGVMLRFYTDFAIDHDIDNIQKMHASHCTRQINQNGSVLAISPHMFLFLRCLGGEHTIRL